MRAGPLPKLRNLKPDRRGGVSLGHLIINSFESSPPPINSRERGPERLAHITSATTSARGRRSLCVMVGDSLVVMNSLLDYCGLGWQAAVPMYAMWLDLTPIAAARPRGVVLARHGLL